MLMYLDAFDLIA